MSLTEDVSVVEFYAEHEGYRCGYCKSNNNYSHGMWAHGLTVQDYQDLIDRGWRRSGCYCYKPTMHLTCCPMYTIKCSALDFKLSKSQKKKLKHFHNFLAYGKKSSTSADDRTNESTSESGDDVAMDYGMNDLIGLKEKAEKALMSFGNAIVNSVESSFKEILPITGEERTEERESDNTQQNVNVVTQSEPEHNVEEEKESTSTGVKKSTRPGEGMDPNRPQCKKAKLLRKERKEKKLAQMGTAAVSTEKTKTAPTAKTLEDFINEPLPDNPAHRLEIRLVRSNPPSKEFKTTFQTSLKLYQRYQMAIHNDPAEKLTEGQFTRFLVTSPLKIRLVNVASAEMQDTLDASSALFAKYQMAVHKEEPSECGVSTYTNFLLDSPLKPWKPQDGPPQGYGSFHQQYWLDGKLIAVGVIDILPLCVSSVYFFYDPDYHFLVLGTYGSLREIAFCRSLHHTAPSLRFYYMGFYIHSCTKMRYKGAFSPSFLLCPETYTWHPIEQCIKILERSKYSRFSDDQDGKDSDIARDVKTVSVLFQNAAMSYRNYLALKPIEKHRREVTQYLGLVGDKLARRMLLVLM